MSVTLYFNTVAVHSVLTSSKISTQLHLTTSYFPGEHSYMSACLQFKFSHDLCIVDRQQETTLLIHCGSVHFYCSMLLHCGYSL